MDKIEIPFGAYDSETLGWTYTIPKGYTAKIEDGKIIVKKEETEDEKIRKKLIKTIGYFRSRSIDQQLCEEFLAWLEKQKELPTNEEMLRTLRAEYEKGVADTIAKYEEKEQKPSEWDDYTKTNLDRAIQIIKKAKGKLQSYQTDDGIYECDKAIECLEHFLYRGLEIEKTAVWSEEDNEVLQQVIADIEDLIAAETSPGFLAKYNKHLDWLKLLPERFYLTPKQEWGEVELEFRGEKVKVKRPFFRDDKGHEYSTTEQDEDIAWYAFRAWCEKKGVSLYDLYPREEWSEEDEKILNELLDHCNTENATWYNWLKSLRPQPKAELTLLDKNIIDAAVAFIEQNDHFNCWRGVDKHTVIKALRSLKPRWKPSEEQMEALDYAIAEWDGGKKLEGLYSLRNELRKLM